MFYKANNTGWKNVPKTMSSGVVIGCREVYYRNSIHVCVKITELYPMYGKTYYNFYNNGNWGGWTEQGTSVVLYDYLEIIGHCRVNGRQPWSLRTHYTSGDMVISHARNTYHTNMAFTITGKTLKITENNRLYLATRETQDYAQDYINKIITLPEGI